MSSALFSKQNLLCRLAEQQHCRKLSMCDCVHTQKMSLTTLIQNRGCLRYTCTQYTKSSKQRACRTTIFNNTFIVWLFAHKRCCCKTLTTLTHTEDVVHMFMYTQCTTSSKQRLATFLQRKEQSGQVLGATLPPTTNFCVNIFFLRFFDTIFSI